VFASCTIATVLLYLSNASNYWCWVFQ